MHHLRPTGRGAASRKYDILTALGAKALRGSQHEQRRVLRLMTLITARYNWQRDRLCVGQREIARMWSCDERTVKREMARLKALGWLVVLRQGARGRVTEYSLSTEALLEATRGVWKDVGPDFEARLTTSEDSHAEGASIVPLPVKGTVPAPTVDGNTEWDIARVTLHASDPGLYAAWLHALQRQGRAGGRLILKAPSRFHASYVATHLVARILSSCSLVDETIESIEVIS
jgi:hypothetical protein